jgi:hypothetical protein
MGKKTKLTPAVQKKIVDAIAAGNYDYIAAQAAGICKDTFYHWLKQGETATGGIYSDFSDAVKKAEADAEQRNAFLIQKAAADTWTAAAWWLERKHPSRWAKTDKFQHTGKDGETIKFEEVKTDEDALLIAAEYIKRKRSDCL